ncbi:LAGLIDADG-like domain protein [Candidatus Norongarragalina meridionalis]|nr:LAGLIDADG-like domain protein [Candidatus Norongarragalina meridionalis]
MQVTIPEEFSHDLAEETGLHAGDGSMNYYSGNGLYSLRGNKKTDAAFYSEIVLPLYEQIYSFRPILRKWREVIGFQVASSVLVAFKQQLGLPIGPKNELPIPKWVWDNGFETDFVRGVFETDGCVYLENKNGRKYPRMEISTTSEQLAKDLAVAIEKQGIPTSYWKQSYSNDWKPLHHVCVRGIENTRRWMEKIGTNHPTQKAKLSAVRELRTL